MLPKKLSYNCTGYGYLSYGLRGKDLPTKPLWAQAAAPDQGPQAAPKTRPRPNKVRWPAAQGAARQCSTQVPAGTRAEAVMRRGWPTWPQPAQMNLPQVSHTPAVAKAVRTPARKLMPSARPENALRWPRRETAAGLASISQKLTQAGLSQSRPRAGVQALRTVPRSDLPQALRWSTSEAQNGRCWPQPLPWGQAASSHQAPSPQRTHSQSRE